MGRERAAGDGDLPSADRSVDRTCDSHKEVLMSGREYWPEDGPGKWVCRECGSDNLTFEGDGTWNVEEQRMEFEENSEKPFCQQCELRGWAKFIPLTERMAPQLDRHYVLVMFILVGDDGQPIGGYQQNVHKVREVRDRSYPEGRICRVAFTPTIPDKKGLIHVVDDPKAPPAEDPE